MLTAFLIGIGATLGLAFVMIGFALAAKAMFFKQSEDEGYGN